VAIADEAYSNCGFSAEIAAMAAEEALDELGRSDSAHLRVAGAARL